VPDDRPQPVEFLRTWKCLHDDAQDIAGNCTATVTVLGETLGVEEKPASPVVASWPSAAAAADTDAELRQNVGLVAVELAHSQCAPSLRPWRSGCHLLVTTDLKTCQLMSTRSPATVSPTGSGVRPRADNRFVFLPEIQIYSEHFPVSGFSVDVAQQCVLNAAMLAAVAMARKRGVSIGRGGDGRRQEP
jgi:hypothetical protein